MAKLQSLDPHTPMFAQFEEKTGPIVLANTFFVPKERSQLLGRKRPSLLTRFDTASLMLPTAPYDRTVTGHIYRSPLCGDRVGHVDEYPRRGPSLCDVDPGDVVGWPSEAAPTTWEVVPPGVRPSCGPACAGTGPGGARSGYHCRWWWRGC